MSAALYNIFIQLGNIIASNIYRKEDHPLYIRGNKILLRTTVFNIILFYLVKVFYIWRNTVRDRRWNALLVEEKEDYILYNKDKRLKRLDFRFAH